MAERRGIFQRSDLSRVQAHGLAILHDRDEFAALERRAEDRTNALKYALVANDPSRISALFPTLAPPTTTEETIQALDTGAPVRIETTESATEVEDFFRMMEDGELQVTDLDGLLSGEGEY